MKKDNITTGRVEHLR